MDVEVMLWLATGSDQGVTAGFDRLNDYKMQTDRLPAKASVIPIVSISHQANNQIALRFFKGYKGAIHLDFVPCSCCVLSFPLSPSPVFCLLIRNMHCEHSTPSESDGIGSRWVRDTAIRDFNLIYL